MNDIKTISPLKQFPQFCENLTINSKEHGLVKLHFWGTQRYYLEEIQRGMEDGVREFIALKGRQGGISTVSLALLLYWINKYRGSLGAMITDDGSNLVRFRSILSGYMKSLWKSTGTRYCGKEEHHNINELEMLNGSVVSYLVAGKRAKKEQGDLGQGKGLNLLHATEVSSWGDEKQVQKLSDSLAETHPNRLYLWESTANGFNLFYDMCQTAKKAVNQRLIFIGWWRHDLYRFNRDSQIYRVYWDGKLSAEEARWCRDIKQLYGVEITPEQMAWWRYQLNEKKHGDMNALFQEHPPTEEYAFVMSGYKYFSPDKLTQDYKAALRKPHVNFRYTFGMEFKDLGVHKTTEANAELVIWEGPVSTGTYSISVDPAWGLNEHSDQSVVEVCRCYADRLEQVAEYAARGVRTDQLAWVIMHLVGKYRNCRVNIELTGGGGAAVYKEIEHIFRNRENMTQDPDAYEGLRMYYYSRPDALAKSFALHSKTGNEQKNIMMNFMNNLWSNKQLVINSCLALNEMKYFCKDGDILEGRGGSNDDTVICLALNVIQYWEWARPPLLQVNYTYEKVKKDEAEGKTMTQNIVTDFLKSRGIVIP